MSSAATSFASSTRAPDAARVLRLMLAAGDERLCIDAGTGRNRYGVPPSPDSGEAWFSSSTASPISRRAHQAVAARLERLVDGVDGARLDGWPAELRARLDAACGVPGCAVILAGSGTEAELIALVVARAILRRPLLNIVVAPGETGSGVLAACAGRHFLGSASLAPDVAMGTLLSGIAPGEVATRSVAIREEDGGLRPAREVDAEVLAMAGRAIAEGHDVLAHCLDASKTGVAGFSRAAAAESMARWPGRCLTVVDACQFRCDPAEVRRDLTDGFMVMVTGSKFMGGPPFAGALLVPPSLRARFDTPTIPEGLRAYSAALDWPGDLLRKQREAFATEVNLGLCCRWEAALTEIERLVRAPSDHRAAIVERFGALVRRGAEATGLRIVAQPAGRRPTLFAVTTADEDGRPVAGKPLQAALARDGFRVGQPVAVGAAEALRVALSAPQVCDAAERMAAGAPVEAAMAPIETQLDGLFDAWSRLRRAPPAAADSRLRP